MGHFLQWFYRSQSTIQISDTHKYFCFVSITSGLTQSQWWIYRMRHLWLVKVYFYMADSTAAQTKLIPGYYVWITLRCHVRLSSAKFKCLLKRYSISHSKAILAFLQNPRKWQFVIEASSAVDHESNWHPGYWSPSRVTSRENCQYQTIYSTRVSERRDECLPACFVCSNTNLRSEDLQY